MSKKDKEPDLTIWPIRSPQFLEVLQTFLASLEQTTDAPKKLELDWKDWHIQIEKKAVDWGISSTSSYVQWDPRCYYTPTVPTGTMPPDSWC